MIGDIVSNREHKLYMRNLPRLAFAPLPLPVIQPILAHVVSTLSKKRPDLANRLGHHKRKHFLLDATNMPFVLILRPDPEDLLLRAYRRRHLPNYDARIAGTVLTLLDMIDGRLDGDALFFSRDLLVEGDTEAVVCLRNSLDDVEGSIATDIANIFKGPGHNTLNALRRIRSESHVG